jgi:YD repeat-containing protein
MDKLRKRTVCSFVILVLVIVCTASPPFARAQQGGITTYVHDDNGRLHAVISPGGDAVVYEYDAAGNVTAIRRLAHDSLAIFSFSPREGLPGDQVTFIGLGFGGGVTDVSFNGASALVVSVTPSKVVTTVPQTATTGLVTITTPNGSVSTMTPFAIAGMRIVPSFAAIKFGESVQFTADVLPATLDQTVQWSVEDINGGNAEVGTVSAAGIYAAPNKRFSSLTIRATSLADRARFAEGHVRVNDPNDVQSVFAAAVSVQRSDSLRLTPSARPVTVRYNAGTALQTAFALPISVQYEKPSGVYTAQTTVSSTMGPYVQTIMPSSLSRGETITLTISGVGLSGATALRFITTDGAIDTNFTVSNITVNGDGSSLTAIINVNAGAAVGSRVVIIATPNGDSVGVDLGINKINVQ